MRTRLSCLSLSRLSILVFLTTLLVGCTHQERYHLNQQVTARAETTPVPSMDDAADDPAIWVNHAKPETSLVLGTDKRSGLLAYDLTGQQVQYLPVGDLNNVDLRQGAWGQAHTVVAATQRNPSRIVLFSLDHSNGSVELRAKHETRIVEPYGMCMYVDTNQQPHVIANGKSGVFVDYLVKPDYGLEEVGQWQTQTQPEGCVVDDERQVAYYGEEGRGVWFRSLGKPGPGALVAEIEGSPLVADVEGLSLYLSEQVRILVVSSQGDNSFALYHLDGHEYIGSFHVVPGGGVEGTIDGVSETDGLDVTAVALPGYPSGLLVVQDGYNLNPTEAQNFKYVSWDDVAALFNLRHEVVTTSE